MFYPVSNAILNHVHGGFLDLKESLIIGIVLHNIPVTVALVSLLRTYTISSFSKNLILIVFGLMAPLGSLTGEFLEFLKIENLELIIRVALGIVVGIFLHISTTIMFENSENHKYNYQKLISIVLGIFFAIILS